MIALRDRLENARNSASGKAGIVAHVRPRKAEQGSTCGDATRERDAGRTTIEARVCTPTRPLLHASVRTPGEDSQHSMAPIQMDWPHTHGI